MAVILSIPEFYRIADDFICSRAVPRQILRIQPQEVHELRLRCGCQPCHRFRILSDRTQQKWIHLSKRRYRTAVSIHKAQGLEYDSVKIVITDEVEELVTHNIFYTAITRAREKLKIYWTPEVEEKVINRIRPRDISKDVELLKNYLTEKQPEDSPDFGL